MRSAIRSCVLLLLLPALLATGLGGAWARGQAPAVGTVELCLGLTARTVAVDAHGQPTAPPHLCGESALLLILALAETAPGRDAARVSAFLPPRIGAARLSGRGAPVARARGPPALL